jgi:aspartyl-tRNA(Asn)/glutamyl-tRNA(Gln) amidotransferase subunit C
VLPLANVMAEDVARPSLPNADALANAPDAANGFFRVAAVFEE